MRYARLIIAFIRTSLQQEMAYRFDFLINILYSLLGLAGGIGGISILYANNESLNGWSFPEILALLGVYLLVQSFKDLVTGPSLNKLAGMGGEIESGAFDFVLLKPVPVQFHISVRVWSLWSIFNILVSITIMGIAVHRLGISYNMGELAAFLLSLFLSQVLLYSILLILSSVAFWYRGTFLLWVMNDVMQAGRYPVGIYPGFIKLVLTWIIPVGFIVTVPAEILAGKVDYFVLAGGVLLAIVLFLAATVLFRKSLGKYTSASS
jgi:ABC-2 type transport system permease protein